MRKFELVDGSFQELGNFLSGAPGGVSGVNTSAGVLRVEAPVKLREALTRALDVQSVNPMLEL